MRRSRMPGREIARDGRLTSPMAEAERAEVLAVERGEEPVLADVLDRIEAVQGDFEGVLATGRTPLPAEPDLAAVSTWSVDAHRRHWAGEPGTGCRSVAAGTS